MLFSSRKKDLSVTINGITFPNPVGLAAGFDKEGRLLDGIRTLGFGFTEIGTVTPIAQPGNPKPRLFRLKKDAALINRMGFNSEGADAVLARLMQRRVRRIPIGISISKNTSTPNSGALEDYLECVEKFHRQASYFAMNLSCPNVQCLSELQSPNSIVPLIKGVKKKLQELGCEVPLFVKFGPDQSKETLTYTVKLALEHGVNGFIVVNTSTDRSGLSTPPATLEIIGKGGLSGSPLFKRTMEAVSTVRTAAGPNVPIIGVGGISNGEEALRVLQAGANLVQLFTGFIYKGPGLPKQIVRYLRKHRESIPTWRE